AETKLGRIGLLICYDAFFPELSKAYALQGADLLAIISASPATSKPLFDRILPARAIENALPVLYANLVGTELNIVFQGGTQAIGPRGEDLGKAADLAESRSLPSRPTPRGSAGRAARPRADKRRRLRGPAEIGAPPRSRASAGPFPMSNRRFAGASRSSRGRRPPRSVRGSARTTRPRG